MADFGSSAAATHGETLRVLPSGSIAKSASVVDSFPWIKVATACAALSAPLATVPTMGLANTSSTRSEFGGDPPDLRAMFPASWVNVVDLRKFGVIDVSSVPALIDLQRLRSYQDGWNGPRSYGAVASSFDAAERFVRQLLSSYSHLSVKPTIFSDGNAALEIKGKGVDGVLAFGSEQTISASLDTSDGPVDLDVQYTPGRLPKEIANYL